MVPVDERPERLPTVHGLPEAVDAQGSAPVPVQAHERQRAAQRRQEPRQGQTPPARAEQADHQREERETRQILHRGELRPERVERDAGRRWTRPPWECRTQGLQRIGRDQPQQPGGQAQQLESRQESEGGRQPTRGSELARHLGLVAERVGDGTQKHQAEGGRLESRVEDGMYGAEGERTAAHNQQHAAHHGVTQEPTWLHLQHRSERKS